MSEPQAGDNSASPAVVRVLVLNGHDDSRALLRRLLGRLGFFSEGAADLGEASALYQRESFDLIICETHFGDGDYADLLRAQRAARGTRGLAFSADAHDAAAGLAAGFDGYLAQPASVEALAAAIGRVLSGAAPVTMGGARPLADEGGGLRRPCG